MASRDAVEEFLRNKKEAVGPENADKWRQLEDLYSKKLWHPLTLKLKEFMYDKQFTKELDMNQMYESVIHEFEHRLKPLSLVEIILPIARAKKEVPEAITFMENIEKTVKGCPEAVVRVLTAIAELKLSSKDSSGRCTAIEQVREIIEDCQSKLDRLEGVTSVHAEFYRVSSVYLREIGDFGSYYKEALRYLGCVDMKTVTEDEQRMQAICLGLAALLGEDVYNFGELLAHPILSCLQGSKEKWLVDVLYAFNSGDLDKFYALKSHWSAWNDIVNREKLLNQKIRLLCLMEIAFARDARNRHIGFEEIAHSAQVNVDEVEFLVMKGLSRGLIRGHIDQVNKKINVTWVQPRVLDKAQVSHMASKIGVWCRDVEGIERLVESNAKEILTR